MRGKGYFVLVALLLAACSSPAEPQTLPTPSASPQASVSERPDPSASAPDTPDPVAAAMDSYFEKANAASRGQRIDVFRAAFEPSCSVCLVQYNNFTEAYARGQRAQGRLYESWDVDVQSVKAGTAVVTTTADTGKITLLGENDQVISVFEAEQGIATVWSLNKRPSGWIVTGAQDLP